MTSEDKSIEEKNFMKAKADRSNTRKIFNKLIKKITESLENGEMNDEILVHYENLSEKARHLHALDQIVKDWYLEQEMDLEQEYEVADKYQNEFRLLSLKYDRVLKEVESKGATSEVQAKRQFKLPHLELVKFDGNIKNWIPFWAQFSKIHCDDSIDNHDKFQYLVAAIPKGTTARELINSFPPSSDNYPIAIEHLKQRFGREDRLVNVYIRELLNLILSQANNKYALPLSSLYDQLTTQLRALETMGLTSDKFALLLFPLVESALPSDTLKAWERSQAGIQAKAGNNLNNILSFLKHEVESNQRVSLAHSTFGVKSTIQSFETHDEEITPTTSCFTTSDQRTVKHIEHCIWCDKESHPSSNCVKAVGMSLDDRKRHIKKVRGCSNCLKIGHNSFKCRAFVKCVACHKRHNILFCPEISQVCKNKQVSKSDGNSTDNQLSISHFRNVTLLQTLLVKIIYDNKEVTIRALIDSGAQRSYVKRSVVQFLNLPMIDEEELGHIVFGGIETKKELRRLYNITITDVRKSVKFNMNVYDEERICGYLPRVHETEILEKLRKNNICLTDVGQSHMEIGLLIGADYCGLLLTNRVIQLKDKLTAVETILGWTLQGVKSISDTSSGLTSLLVNDINNLWELEHLGIRDPAETKSREQIENEALVKFENSVIINQEGRYEVCLPWKDSEFMDTSLSNNYDLAYKRLLSNTKRLLRYNIYNKYNEVFADWLRLGIIEEVREDDRSGHYLCHHAVVKDSSLTTKIRPIFDASARDKSGRSLNSCLSKGVNLLELIPKLLINFRLRTVGVTADIEKAFLQISIKMMIASS